ncbi:MAG: glycosyl transferase [Saprospiraceae bacterium]|nr:MAG: glycosyl transferase [Saprospiraceae bacterium]
MMEPALAFPWWWAMVGTLLAMGYVAILLLYAHGWKRMPDWEPPPGYTPSAFCSILVPARNEAENLLRCLSSLACLDYPSHLFEVITIDDHSTDDTLKLARQFARGRTNFKVLSLAAHQSALPPDVAYKKAAITLGVQHARGPLILTTDADCEVPPRWLMLMSSLFEAKRPVFIAAPVMFQGERTLFERFQSLDMLGMMCSTASGIYLGLKHMSNGANLAYSKAAFEAIGGFAGIAHLASGDDILLMQKMAARFPGQTTFLKHPEATVRTRPQPTVSAFIQQRVRWASKSTAYREWTVTFILGWVFLYCWYILLSLAGVVLFGLGMGILFLATLVVKLAADFFYLRMMAKFFRREDLLKSYVASQFIHIAYIAGVGLLGMLVRRYEWKGRKLR